VLIQQSYWVFFIFSSINVVGGFEQVDFARYRKALIESVAQLIQTVSSSILSNFQNNTSIAPLQEIHNLWSMFLVRSAFSQQQ
jgi:hypothetical protein